MSETRDHADILIAGAGIGGLSTALMLHAEGIRSTVLEAAATIRPLGVGMNVQPAAIAELISLGFHDDLVATSIPTREHRYLDHIGSLLWTDPRGLDAGFDVPQYSVHRGWLQELLLAAVLDRIGPDAVRTDSRLTGVTDTATGVRVRLADGAELHVAALIGADGVHSAVREALHPDGPPLAFSGTRMWRGATELDRFLDGRTMVLANDDRANRLIAYPISAEHRAAGRTLLNWVAILPTEPAGVLDAHEARNQPASATELAPYFKHWDLSLIGLDLPSVFANSPEILRYPMADRDPLPCWGRGPVTLLGDAAHPMYPVGANGASQAILDARAMTTALAGHPDPAAAFRSYEAKRRPVTTDIVLANREMNEAERLSIDRGGDRSADIARMTDSYHRTVSRAG